MNEKTHALVVDDEVALRQLTVRSLTNCGFECDEASDGVQAAEMLGRSNYDVVVTDLRMPKRNGHSLAVELLDRGADRPLVIVLTGVLEPRLAADLMARGIDDIVFKPVDFKVFGTKVRAVYDRRQKQLVGAGGSSSVSLKSGQQRPETTPITTAELEQRLEAMAGMLPMSHAAVEASRQFERQSTKEIACSIARDPALLIEALRLANAGGHRSGDAGVDDLQQAIARIGYLQLRDVVLASSTVRTLGEISLDWIDPQLMWHRSLATGLAIQKLQPAAEIGEDEEDAFLAALLLPMSRLFLGLAFPELYADMAVRCRNTGCTLQSLERRLLPMSPARAMAGVLARWNFPPRLFKPLQRSALSYQEISSLSEPLRSKVERLRFAEFLGQVAVGRFESWDEIDFPPPETLSRLRVSDLELIVDQIRIDLGQILEELRGSKTADSTSPVLGSHQRTELNYFKLAVEPYDLLMLLVPVLGVRRVSRDVACQSQKVLINCLDVSDHRLEWFLDDAIPDSGRTLICSAQLPSQTDSWGRVIQVPCSFRVLSDAIMAATKGA